MKNGKGASINETARHPKGSSSSYRKGTPTGSGPGPYPSKPMPKDFSAGKFQVQKP